MAASTSREVHASQVGDWNESNHRSYLDVHATHFGTLGISLAALELPRVPKPGETAPLLDEMLHYGSQVYRRFPFMVDAQGVTTERMSAETVARFHKAGDSAEKTLETNLAAERAVLAKVLATVSPSMRQALDNLAGSSAALATHDPYTVWPFLLRAVTVPGARRAMKIFQELIELTMDGECANHAAYAARFRRTLVEFTHMFQDTSEGVPPNTVSIDVIGAVLYLNGILNSRSRAQFQFIVDKTLASVVVMSDLPSPMDLIVTFQSFAANLRQDTVTEPVVAYGAKVDPGVPPGKPVRAKVDLASRKCATCKIMFLPFREAHLLCKSCAIAKSSAARSLVAVVAPSRAPVDPPLTRGEYEAQLSPMVQQLIMQERHLAQSTGPPGPLSSFPYQNLLRDSFTVDAGAASEALWPPSAFILHSSGAPECDESSFEQDFATDLRILSQPSSSTAGPQQHTLASGFRAQSLLHQVRSSDAYADSGATYHCTNDLSSLRCVTDCEVFCGGVGAGITFSHVGIDPRLPIGLRKTLFHPEAARLLSTGYLSSTGRGASIQQADGTLHFYVDGQLLFSAPRQRNNLYPTPLVDMCAHPAVHPEDLILDHDYARLPSPPLDCPSGFPRGAVQPLLLQSAAHHVAFVPAPAVPLSTPACNLTPVQYYYSPICESALVSSPLALAALGGLNSEQRRRVDQADELVRFLGYPAIDSVATSVSMGSFALSSPLDAKDLRNLYTVRGPSPHYYAGYFNQKPMRSSTTPPASAPGHTLSIDVHKLSVPSLNGYTHEIRIVSEFEGMFSVVPAKSKHTVVLFEALHAFIAATYNARSHRVVNVHADAEGVFKAAQANFGSIGVVLTCSPPGQHAQRCERYTQTLNTGVRSTLDALPYVLPPELQLYLDMNVADGMSLVTNSASFPFTPYELVYQRRRTFHSAHPFLAFGTVCSVHMGEVKRAKISGPDVNTSHAPKSEIGVCLGTDPVFPGTYIFYIGSTRQIIPRRVAKVHHGMIPFGWPAKPSMFRTIQQFPVCFDPPTEPNNAVQPGSLPLTDAGRFKDEVVHSSLAPTVTSEQFERSYVPPPPRTSAVTVPSSAPLPPSVVDPSPVQSPALRPTVDVPHSSAGPTVDSPSAGTQAVVSLPPPVVSAPIVPAAAPTAAVAPTLRRSSRSTRGQAAPHLTYHERGHSDPTSYLSAASRALSNVHHISDNFLLPTHHGAGCVRQTVPAPVGSLRSPRRSRPRAPPTVAPVADDDPWFRADPVSLQQHFAFGFMANASAVTHRSCNIPATTTTQGSVLCRERGENPFDLPSEVLGLVSFLPETPASAIPPGLRKPTIDLHEVQYAYAAKHPETYAPCDLAASLEKELHKMTEKMAVLELVTDPVAQVAPGAVYVPSMILTKQKYLTNGEKDCVSSRFALMGNRQDPALCGDTHAATADDASIVCCMSAFQAHALQEGYAADLQYDSFDVCGAFLHVDLVSPVMILTRIPAGIAHPLAGQLCIVRKSCYGLRQSNKAFADDFSATIISAGFVATTDPCIYKKVVPVPGRPAQRCYIGTHVDDGKAMYNHRPLYDHLVSVLEARYGELKKGPLSGFTGTSFHRHPSGAFTRSQDGYILRFLESVNVKGIALSKTPSKPDLFEEDSSSPPCDQSLYKSLIGSLIFTLRTRYDIQKEVVHLSSRSGHPTDADLAKVVLVMRYLAGTPKLGPTYFTKQGPTLVCFVDCSYGTHVDGRCHYGFSLHIGADNAPFYVQSKKQSECVAIGSMEGEYVALSAASRKVLEFRYFLDSIDFPPDEPTVIYEDNMSAINLANAPAVTRRSRHIHIRHHFIRDLVAQKLVRVQYLSTDSMLADLFTKPFGPKKFSIFRGQLLNEHYLAGA